MKYKLIKNLLNTTQEMTTVYEELSIILQEEKQCLIKSVLKEFQECVKKKETLSLKLKMLEETRVELIAELANFFGISQKEVTMKFLSENIEDPYSCSLLEIRAKLSYLLQSIHNRNRENEIIIEHSMEGIRYSFNFFNKATTQNNTYHPVKGVNKSRESGRMICQQV